MGKKQIIYHATTPENAEKIKREGLKRMNGFCVYMSENPLSWWKPGLVVLRVRITGLNDLRTFGTPGLDEIIYFGDISPMRISGEYKIPRRILQEQINKMREVSE